MVVLCDFARKYDHLLECGVRCVVLDVGRWVQACISARRSDSAPLAGFLPQEWPLVIAITPRNTMNTIHLTIHTATLRIYQTQLGYGKRCLSPAVARGPYLSAGMSSPGKRTCLHAISVATTPAMRDTQLRLPCRSSSTTTSSSSNGVVGAGPQGYSTRHSSSYYCPIFVKAYPNI